MGTLKVKRVSKSWKRQGTRGGDDCRATARRRHGEISETQIGQEDSDRRPRSTYYSGFMMGNKGRDTMCWCWVVVLESEELGRVS